MPFPETRSSIVQIKLGEYALEVSVPKKACSYDVIPIRYTLTGPVKGSDCVAVEAVAFDDAKKAVDKPLYDLSVAGNLKVKL